MQTIVQLVVYCKIYLFSYTRISFSFDIRICGIEYVIGRLVAVNDDDNHSVCKQINPMTLTDQPSIVSVIVSPIEWLI